MNNNPKFAVIGVEHCGFAMAGLLGLMSFDVKLYNRTPEKLWGVIATEGIQIESDFGLKGFGKVLLATTNMQEAIEDVDIIMVVVPATAYKFIAAQMA